MTSRIAGRSGGRDRRVVLVGVVVALTFWWDWQERHKDDGDRKP